MDFSFTRHFPFWVLWAGVLCQGLAAFMPATYLPGKSRFINVLIQPTPTDAQPTRAH